MFSADHFDSYFSSIRKHCASSLGTFSVLYSDSCTNAYLNNLRTLAVFRQQTTFGAICQFFHEPSAHTHDTKCSQKLKKTVKQALCNANDHPIPNKHFFFNTAVTIHHCWVCFHLLAISQLNVATSKEVFLRQASFQSHLFNQPFGGGWSAHIMPATSVFNHVYPHSYMVLFFKEGERKKKKTLLYCFLLPRLISAFRCCTALKNHVIMSLFFSSQKNQKKQQCLYSLSLS